MSKKFVDVVGARDIFWGPATWTRIRNLPNGDPFWYVSGTDSGSELPPGTDFITHDWSIAFFVWDYISLWGDHQSFYCSNPDGNNIVWKIQTTYNTQVAHFYQYTTTDGIYRQRSSSSAYSQSAAHHLVIVCPVGATPSFYLDSVLSNGTAVAPTGTPKAVTSITRFKMYGYNANGTSMGLIAKPAYFPKALTASEVSLLYASMTAA